MALASLAIGCRDTPTAPTRAQLASPVTTARDAEPVPSASAEFTVSNEAPLNGNSQYLGHYDYPTLVAMTVHQHFAITVLPPFPPGTGEMGLAGRIWAFGCSHQGEAFLVSFFDGGGYSFSFSGCQFQNDPTRTNYSDTVQVVGTVKYGYSWDSACPYPDYGCAAYTGSSGIQIFPLHATVSLTSDTLHDGELWMWPGQEYVVRAVAAPDRMGRYLTPILPTETGWSFKPDSGAEVSDVCRWGGGRDCEVAFTKPGYLRLTAYVNGEKMQAPPLRIQTPKVSVTLSDTAVSVGDTILLTTTIRGADASILTGYYAGITAFLVQGGESAPSLASPENVNNSGVPPCLGTKPVPLHCYMVMTTAGKAVVGVSARIGRTYFGDYKRVTVMNAPRASVVIVPSSKSMMEFSRQIHAPNCVPVDEPRKRKLHLFVIDSAQSTPAKLPNRVIHLALAPVVPADPKAPDAGGHVVGEHEGNPKPSGSLSALEVTTDANGDAYVTYTASEFAGKYEVRATSESATSSADTITVGIGLQALAAGAHYGFIGRTDAHPSNHFGTPVMNARLVAFADDMYATRGVNVEYNDMSLPLGGRFEVKDTGDPVLSWSNRAHCDHREGRGADLRTRTFMKAGVDTKDKPSAIVKRMMRTWRRLNPDWPGDNDHPPFFWEGDHLHLKTVN